MVPSPMNPIRMAISVSIARSRVDRTRIESV
jgi:hypothetical protein